LHAVVRLAALRFFGSRIGAYVLATLAVGSAIAALTTLPTSRYVAWLAVVAICVATLVATLVAGSIDEAGQVPEGIPDDEPYIPEDLT
jgi:heme A synthase